MKFLSSGGEPMRLPNRSCVVLVTCAMLAALFMHGCGGGGDATGGNPPPVGSPLPVADTTAPSVPQNLVAMAISTTQVNLTWSASTDSGGAGLAGYRVLRGSAQIATTAVTNYSNAGLTAGTAYSYTVRAYDNATPANVSADSSPPANVTTLAVPDTTAPTVPQNLMATAISSSQVNLTWLASTDSGGAGLAGYRIQRGATQIATTVAPNYSDTAVNAGTAYAYTVRAYDNATPANVSADSSVANVTTPAMVVGGLDVRPSNTTCLAGAPEKRDRFI